MQTPTTTFFAAGVQHSQYAEVKHLIATNDKVYIEHDNMNPYDANAIRINWQGEDGTLYRIGFVPKDNPEKGNTSQGSLFQWHHLGGRKFQATIINHFPSNKPWQALQIAVTCEIPERGSGFVDFSL